MRLFIGQANTNYHIRDFHGITVKCIAFMKIGEFKSSRYSAEPRSFVVSLRVVAENVVTDSQTRTITLAANARRRLMLCVKGSYQHPLYALPCVVLHEINTWHTQTLGRGNTIFVSVCLLYARFMCNLRVSASV